MVLSEQVKSGNRTRVSSVCSLRVCQRVCDIVCYEWLNLENSGKQNKIRNTKQINVLLFSGGEIPVEEILKVLT